MTTRSSQLIKARARLAEQRRWIDRCGGSLGGYLMRYGSAADPLRDSPDGPGRIGDGGEAIWKADKAELDALEAEVRRLEGRS